MKKSAYCYLTAAMAFLLLTGCAAGGAASANSTGGAPAGKVVVNFEGTVAAVEEDKVTLEDGKIVILSSETVFAGDPDTNRAVSEEIAVGNFIQGYTEDDPDAGQVSADKIYCNTVVQPGGGKLAINFEGKVSAVEGDRITLESGQVIAVSDDTVYSIASGVVENIILSEGDEIQGCTKDDPADSEITASRIHVIAY